MAKHNKGSRQRNWQEEENNERQAEEVKREG